MLRTYFTKNAVLDVYEKWLKKAYNSFDKKKYDRALKEIAICAKWMYNFNILYFDPRLENLIKQISFNQFGTKVNYRPDDDCCVFLDSIGLNRCLAIQYLRGLMALRKKIIYILHYLDLSQCKDIVDELKEYGNAEIHLIKTSLNVYVDVAKRINGIIIEHRPSSIFLHMRPEDTVSLLAINNLTGSIKYNIDLQDHTFWLGASFIDYNIQFRCYGERVALEKRKLKPEQIVRLPYYPISLKSVAFKGFPKLPIGSVVVFTGGAQYKMLGRNDIFFRLMDIVLECGSNVYILVATIGDNTLFSQKVAQLKHKDRVCLLGMRNDIDEVFKHSDIYLSTYPFLGGLMSQYAAMNSLPILAYSNIEEANSVEGMINHKFNAVKTFHLLGDFREYAEKLVADAELRKKEGARNKAAIMSASDFSFYLNKVIVNRETGLVWNHREQPDYDGMVQFYLENENVNMHSGLKVMITYLKHKSFRYFPKESITIVQCVLRWMRTHKRCRS